MMMLNGTDVEPNADIGLRVVADSGGVYTVVCAWTGEHMGTEWGIAVEFSADIYGRSYA